MQAQSPYQTGGVPIAAEQEHLDSTGAVATALDAGIQSQSCFFPQIFRTAGVFGRDM
jgi:hypothetical protein